MPTPALVQLRSACASAALPEWVVRRSRCGSRAIAPLGGLFPPPPRPGGRHWPLRGLAAPLCGPYRRCALRPCASQPDASRGLAASRPRRLAASSPRHFAGCASRCRCGPVASVGLRSLAQSACVTRASHPCVSVCRSFRAWAFSAARAALSIARHSPRRRKSFGRKVAVDRGTFSSARSAVQLRSRPSRGQLRVGRVESGSGSSRGRGRVEVGVEVRWRSSRGRCRGEGRSSSRSRSPCRTANPCGGSPQPVRQLE